MPTTLACIYVAVLGVAAILLQRSAVPSTMTHAKVADSSVIYALGALAWPFLWSVVCGEAMLTMPALGYIGLLWPPLLLLVDVAFAGHQSGEDPNKRTYAMQVDGNTLSGLALTLGGVLIRYVSDGFSTAASPMMTATVLLVLLFIVPSPSLHADSLNANTFRGVQKVTLQYCLGFVLTALGLAFAVGLKRAAAQPAELSKAIAGA